MRPKYMSSTSSRTAGKKACLVCEPLEQASRTPKINRDLPMSSEEAFLRFRSDSAEVNVSDLRPILSSARCIPTSWPTVARPWLACRGCPGSPGLLGNHGRGGRLSGQRGFALLNPGLPGHVFYVMQWCSGICMSVCELAMGHLPFHAQQHAHINASFCPIFHYLAEECRL